MKKLSLLPACLLFCQIGFGQTPSIAVPGDGKTYKHEIGIDASSVLNIFGNSTFGTNLYTFTYRRNFEHTALRFAFGGNVMLRTNEQDSIDLESNRTNLAGRFGYEWQENFGKRWQVHYGADLSYQYYSYLTQGITSGTPEFFESKYTTHNYGVGPHLGLKFTINPRLKVGTETSYIFSLTQSDDSFWYAVSTQYNRNERATTLQTSYYAPTSVFLLIAL